MNVLFERNKLNGKVCFDLEDKINSTRREWSNVYHCCKNKRDSLTAFFSLFSSILGIALVFYISVYFYGSQVDLPTIDAHAISNRDNNEITHEPNTSTSSNTSNATTATLRSGSQSSKKKSDEEIVHEKKHVSINNDLDDDDDAPLIGDDILTPQQIASTTVNVSNGIENLALFED
jgi:hypothetical protein